MTTNNFMFTCDVCGKQYQHGPHQYEGHRLSLYDDISCCEVCWKLNCNGWAPQYEIALLAQLKRNDLHMPPRNMHIPVEFRHRLCSENRQAFRWQNRHPLRSKSATTPWEDRSM